jgi:hypothetical protein
LFRSKFSRFVSVTSADHSFSNTSRQDIRREQLEDAFVSLLDALAPKPAFRSSFVTHVLDVWREAFADVTTARGQLQQQVSTLERRLAHVDTLFVDERLDEESYRRQRDRTREDLTVARLQLHESDETSADVEGMLAFAIARAIAGRCALDGCRHD